MTCEAPFTPRARVQHALLGRDVDTVPFTVYECMLPTCAAERRLRNRGLCIVDRTVPVVRTHTPDARETATTYKEAGTTLQRTDIDTPHGTLTRIVEPAGFTSWTRRHSFSEPEDYEKLIFLAGNMRYEPCYEHFLRVQDRLGEDIILRGTIGLEPMQQVIMDMGTERWCLEWMDRRDEVVRLYEAYRDARRRLYPLLADSPAWHFNYGGNVVVDVVGPEVVEDFYVPNYNEAADVLHAKGKLVGSHLDANCRGMAAEIAATDLDYIEAFTPAPDTDMTLSEAFAAWPDKALWINFPSSLHLASHDRITQTTQQFIEDAREHPRFLIGITEDVPEDRWQGNFRAIMDGIQGA